ncbi:MAG: acyl-homoserine-lactone synthase [Pseudomonadota bacterium]
MIRFLYADQLDQHKKLAASMFRDRADQFHHRLKWDVSVDADGFEMDQYDHQGAMYVIWEDETGEHAGSMRIMPTTERTMIRDHFSDLTESVDITSPLIWETTRFCLSPRYRDQGRRIAGGVMLAGHELGLKFGLLSAVGVFDARMVKIYRMIGWAPDVLGTRGEGAEQICAGLWPFAPELRTKIAQSAGLDPMAGAEWFEASFPVFRGAEAVAA